MWCILVFFSNNRRPHHHQAVRKLQTPVLVFFLCLGEQRYKTRNQNFCVLASKSCLETEMICRPECCDVFVFASSFCSAPSETNIVCIRPPLPINLIYNSISLPIVLYILSFAASDSRPGHHRGLRPLSLQLLWLQVV